MAGALGLVLTGDTVPVEGRHAIPVYVDDSLPIVGPSRACVVTTGEIPQAGGPPLAVRLAPAGTPAIGPALPVYVVSGSLSSGPPATPPANTVLPLISGVMNIGQNLSTTDGTWTGTLPIVYTYQWKRGGVNIALATANTYTVVAADLGTTITVTVTATNAVGATSATSAGLTDAFANPIGTALAFAYDGRDALLALGAGASINPWADQSGNARNLIQDGAGPLPLRDTLNGYPCAAFATTAKRLATATFGAAIAQPMTTFILIQSTNTASQMDFLDGDGANRQLVYSANATANLGFFAGTNQLSTTTLNNAAAQLVVAQFNGVSSSLWLGGGAAIKTGNTGAQTLPRIFLGTNYLAGNRLIGNVHGLYGYAAALNAAQITAVANYLGGRYGVTVSPFS